MTYLLSQDTISKIIQLTDGMNGSPITPSYNIDHKSSDVNTRQTFNNPNFQIRIMPELEFIKNSEYTKASDFIDKLESTLYNSEETSKKLFIDVSIPISIGTCFIHAVDLDNTQAMNKQLTLTQLGTNPSGSYKIGPNINQSDVSSGLSLWIRCLGYIDANSSGKYRVVLIYDRVSNDLHDGSGTWIGYIIPANISKMPWISTVPFNDIVEIGFINYDKTKKIIQFMPASSTNYSNLVDKQNKNAFYLPGIKGELNKFGENDWMSYETKPEDFIGNVQNDTKWLDAFSHGLHIIFNFNGTYFPGISDYFGIVNATYTTNLAGYPSQLFDSSTNITNSQLAKILNSNIGYAYISPYTPKTFSNNNIVEASDIIILHGYRTGLYTLNTNEERWFVMATPSDIGNDIDTPYKYAKSYERIGSNEAKYSSLENNIIISSVEAGLCECIVESKNGSLKIIPASNTDIDKLKYFLNNRAREKVSFIYGYLWELTPGGWNFVVSSSFNPDAKNKDDETAEWFVIYALGPKCWVRMGVNTSDVDIEDELSGIVEQIDDINDKIANIDFDLLIETEYCKPIKKTIVGNGSDLSAQIHLDGISCDTFDLSANTGKVYGLNEEEKWGMYYPLCANTTLDQHNLNPIDGLLSIDNLFLYDKEELTYKINPMTQSKNVLYLDNVPSNLGYTGNPNDDRFYWSMNHGDTYDAVRFKVLTDVYFDSTSNTLKKVYRSIEMPSKFFKLITVQGSGNILNSTMCD